MDKLQSQIESLLFVGAKPMTVKQLAELTTVDAKQVEEACEALMASYTESASGLALVKNNAKYQMVTSADNVDVVRNFLQQETNSELSRPSLETLTIIAYRGPIAKTDLDRIRGINCSMILRNLLLRGLVEAKSDKKDGEIYYEVSFDFLKFLGVSDLAQLPDYQRLHEDKAVDKFLNKPEELTDEPNMERSEAAEELSDQKEINEELPS